jgi:hypothetical protein
MKRILGDWSLMSLLKVQTAVGLESPLQFQERSFIDAGEALQSPPFISVSKTVAAAVDTIFFFFSFHCSFEKSSSMSFVKKAMVVGWNYG